MFAVVDTFNDKVLSRHRTIENAAKKGAKMQKRVKDANSIFSYIPMTIVKLKKDNSFEYLEDYELEYAETVAAEFL